MLIVSNSDIGAAARSKDAQTSININVYGPRSCATSIGRKFSSSKIWLQRPDWSKPGAAYDDPHFLKIGVEPCEPLDDNIILEDPICDDTDNGIHSSLENVYSMLNRNSHARRTAVDAKMMTPLLPHQEEALDFMLEKENGPVREEYQLWKSLTDDSHDWYQHSIAGIKIAISSCRDGWRHPSGRNGHGQDLLHVGTHRQIARGR